MKLNKFLIITSLTIAGCSSNSNHLDLTKREVKPNEFWWPNKVNLSPLRQHSAESSPYGSNYEYSKEFAKLDIDILKKEIKKVMMTSMILSFLFLVSYICHHLLSDSTSYGGNGISRLFYFGILISHIILAAVILPFILYTSYRAMVAEWPAHRKLARITWPIWFYVSVTGVIVYLMISPYYV
jgi:hypothetical protein